MDNIPHLRTIRRNLDARSKIVAAIRLFFSRRSFLEVDTPSLTSTPIPEANIELVPVGTLFLNASPEIHMKQLLGAGYGDIFQICHSFRHAERGRLHNPEFTILEWYRVKADYNLLMGDCESLLLFIADYLGRPHSLVYQGRPLALEPGWPRNTVRQAYQRWAGWDPVKFLDHDRFDMDMVDRVEPGLIGQTPVFLMDYPANMSSLARIKPDNPEVAERFELYAGGLELANGFTELTDGDEQRKRFGKENERRVAAGFQALPMPETFLSALQMMPQSAGCALGVDRLVMLFCDAANIDDVMPFPGERA